MASVTELAITELEVPLPILGILAIILAMLISQHAYRDGGIQPKSCNFMDDP